MGKYIRVQMCKPENVVGKIESCRGENKSLRLKTTNERQDDGAGILHQVAQFPIDQVYFIYTRCPCPSPPT